MHSLQLINPAVCPPDGFRYVCPETGFIAHAWTHTDWIQVMRNHLVANNLPVPPDLVAQMETQLCQTLDPGWCSYDDPNRPRVSTVMTWDDVKAGLDTFARWVKAGAKYVTQEEADRRALICSRCYMNVHVQGCAACQVAVKAVVRDVKSKYDSSLKGCAVCKCLLSAKVHFPISSLDTDNQGMQNLYPEFCWLRKKGQNYRG